MSAVPCKSSGLNRPNDWRNIHYTHLRSFHQLRFKHDELCRIIRTDWVYGNESESTSRAFMQALNPLARQHARPGIGRVIPETLSRHGRNFLVDRVAVALCIGEITMNESWKRFISKANNVNAKARHTGDSILKC